jgi:hypothetical protein
MLELKRGALYLDTGALDVDADIQGVAVCEGFRAGEPSHFWG